MPKNQKLKLPISLVILDSIGAILIGLGLYELFTKGSGLLGNSIDPKIMIIIGGCLMLPAIVHIIKFVRRASGSGPREI